MSISREQEYIDCVSRALGGYQLVEELLKRHIDISFKFVNYKLGGSIPFKFSGRDYENAPLERLITAFGKLSENTSLIKTLNKLKEDRNYVAHQSLVTFLKEERNKSDYKAALVEMNVKADLAWVCADQIREETLKVVSAVEQIAKGGS